MTISYRLNAIKMFKPRLRSGGKPCPMLAQSVLVFAIRSLLIFVSPLISGNEKCFGQSLEPKLGYSRGDIQKSTNEELIDQFTFISEFGHGFHPNALTSGFVAAEPTTVEGGVFGSGALHGGLVGAQAPSAHPAMVELVRRGVDALPDLIAHLSDARETQVVVNAGGSAGGTWHSDEYDPRYRIAARIPDGVNTGMQEVIDEDYTLRVGDLCFVAIGQITNRKQRAARYQPSGCYVINSPVATPKVAEAIRQDWSKVTTAELERSLVTDIQQLFWDSPGPALERLSFYYPETAAPIATKLLARPLYDGDVVWDFITNELTELRQVDDWKRLIDTFRIKHGDHVAKSIPFWLHYIYWKSDSKQNTKFQKQKAVAEQILTQVYVDYDKLNPPSFEAAAQMGEQSSVLQGVRFLKSEQIDEAAHSLFVSAVESNIEISDEFAILIAERLKETMKKYVYVQFFEKRISSFKKELNDLAASDRPGLKLYYEKKISMYETVILSLE